MFAKDAPFHFILASHLQPVDQVDHPDHFEQNALQNEVGGWGRWNIPPPPTWQQGWRDTIPKPFMLLQRPPRSQIAAVAWLVFFLYCRFETRQMRFGIRWCLVCFKAFRPGMDRLNLACRKCRWCKSFVLWKVVLEFNAGIVMEHISKEALPWNVFKLFCWVKRSRCKCVRHHNNNNNNNSSSSSNSNIDKMKDKKNAKERNKNKRQERRWRWWLQLGGGGQQATRLEMEFYH